jgi:hypothetical protein
MDDHITQLQDARRARQNAQKMRLLAAARAARLESQLKDAAEAGMRAEMLRRLTARRRLLAVRKVAAETLAECRSELNANNVPAAGRATRGAGKPIVRYSGAAAIGLLVGAAVSALAPFAAVLPGSEKAAAQPSVLLAAPGDGLKLAYSYTFRPPAGR